MFLNFIEVVVVSSVVVVINELVLFYGSAVVSVTFLNFPLSIYIVEVVTLRFPRVLKFFGVNSVVFVFVVIVKLVV